MDLNTMAAKVIAKTVERDPVESTAQKNGRRGGLKGGSARAAKLTPEQRSEIARKAATARWARKDAPTAQTQLAQSRSGRGSS
jgi:hypothetical protein